MQNRHEEQKSYKCDNCEKSFTSVKYLQKHQQDQNKKCEYNAQLNTKGRIQCGSCEMTFASEYNLKRHILGVHEGYKGYKCDLCGMSFGYSSVLHTHKKSHFKDPKEDDRPYICESCGKAFARKNDLTRHNYTVHEGHRDYKCDNCGKFFSTKGCLKTHIQIVFNFAEGKI